MISTRDWYILREGIKLGKRHPDKFVTDLNGSTEAAEILESAPSVIEDGIVQNAIYALETIHHHSADSVALAKEAIEGLEGLIAPPSAEVDDE
jgi:hypothetical protein